MQIRQPAIVALCTQEGSIVGVIHDNLGLEITVEQPLASSLNLSSQSKVCQMLDAIARRGVVLNCELDFLSSDRPARLFVSACSICDEILLVGWPTPSSWEALRLEVARLFSAQTYHLAGRSNVHPKTRRDDMFSVVHRPEETQASDANGNQLQQEMCNTEAFRMFGIAVHGLRNPASGILSAAEYLVQEEAESFSEKQINLLEAVMKSASFMLRMVADIEQMYASPLGKLNLNRHPSDLLCLVKLALRVNEARAANMRIGFDLLVEGHTFVLDLDAIRISQVIDSLLQNAIQFSSEGSKIDVMLGMRQNCASVSVRDYGAGIPKEQIDALFQPFAETRSRPGFPATGFELAISRRIVEAHGGSMTVQSQTGTGSTFTVNLPTLTHSKSDGKGRPYVGERRRTRRGSRSLRMIA